MNLLLAVLLGVALGLVIGVPFVFDPMMLQNILMAIFSAIIVLCLCVWVIKEMSNE